MGTYVIRTDALLLDDIQADSIDEAVEIFCEDEPGMGNIHTAKKLFAYIDNIGDGAWCWIDDPNGYRMETEHAP